MDVFLSCKGGEYFIQLTFDLNNDIANVQTIIKSIYAFILIQVTVSYTLCKNTNSFCWYSEWLKLRAEMFSKCLQIIIFDSTNDKMNVEFNQNKSMQYFFLCTKSHQCQKHYKAWNDFSIKEHNYNHPMYYVRTIHIPLCDADCWYIY